jgi:hypothetical protein
MLCRGINPRFASCLNTDGAPLGASPNGSLRVCRSWPSQKVRLLPRLRPPAPLASAIFAPVAALSVRLPGLPTLRALGAATKAKVCRRGDATSELVFPFDPFRH